MYTLRIRNANGQQITLTQAESDYQVVKVLGLNPPPGQVNLTAIAGLDGAKFNSAKLNTRNIVITVKLCGDVEGNRQNLYRMFRTADACTVYYTNRNRNVYIEGYVETVECDLFAMSEEMQISIICPDPYLKAMNMIIADISNEVAGFHFPFSINDGEPIPFSVYIANRESLVENDSESETGMVINIAVQRDCSTIKIQNIDTGQWIAVSGTYLEGDEIYINTNKGRKQIHLVRNGMASNIFPDLVAGSVFLQLAVGQNHFGYLVDNGAGDEFVVIQFMYRRQYRGV